MTRVVAITGASSGIGRATALRLARDGHALAICARRLEPLHQVADEIVSAGGQALALAADVTQPTAMHDFVSQAVSRFGRLDVMMCNAGFGLYGAVDAIDPADMRRVMDVNFMGTYHAIHAALPVFRRAGRGHLLVISSIVGRRGIPFMGAYAATKFAQAGLAECLRAELRGTGIHVTAVYPISTSTEFFSVMTRESGFETEAPGPRQDVAVVAEGIARAIERPVAEIFPSGISRALVILNALAPGFTDGLTRRWGRKPVQR